MTTKVLGIGGSHRTGNTDAMLARAMEGAASQGVETETVLLRHLRINVCGMCDEHCNRNGLCPMDDGMQGLYQKLRQANGLVLASPIHFRSISAQTKLMVDRCQTLWATKHLLHGAVADVPVPRPGAFIAVSNQEKPQEYPGALTVVKSLFATLDVSYAEELLLGGLDWPGHVREHPEYLDRAYELGMRLASQAKASAGVA